MSLLITTGCSNKTEQVVDVKEETITAPVVDELLTVETTEPVEETASEEVDIFSGMIPVEGYSSSFVWKFGDTTQYINTVITITIDGYKDFATTELDKLFSEESFVDPEKFQPRVYAVTFKYEVGDYTIPIEEWKNHITVPRVEAVESYPGGFGLIDLNIYDISGSVLVGVRSAVEKAVEERSSTIVAKGNIYVLQQLLEKDSVITFSSEYMDLNWSRLELPPINKNNE